MAKVRVRALQRGFDGQSRRAPGDEFDYDIDVHGKGRWFEVIDEPKSITSNHTFKKVSKKTSGKKHSDELLA
jgi:hypothetical protein